MGRVDLVHFLIAWGKLLSDKDAQDRHSSNFVHDTPES